MILTSNDESKLEDRVIEKLRPYPRPLFVDQANYLKEKALGSGDRKKAGEMIEIVQNQKDGRRIAPSRSPLKDLSVCGEVGDLTAVSNGYGKFGRISPAFFRSQYRVPGLFATEP